MNLKLDPVNSPSSSPAQHRAPNNEAHRGQWHNDSNALIRIESNMIDVHGFDCARHGPGPSPAQLDFSALLQAKQPASQGRWS